MKDRTRQVLLFDMPTDIDFALLQKQKEWLVNQPKVPEVEGLLGFLDWFQDTAEFALGKEGPYVVFGGEPMPRVIFRRWRDQPRTVIALFPDSPCDEVGTGTKGKCRSYTALNGFVCANYEHVIHLTTVATPKEYSALETELCARGLNIAICKHEPTQFRSDKKKKAE